VRCEECEEAADGDAKGWRALISNDPRDDEPPEVAIYCPDCASREFGPRLVMRRW
jgi:hypothetical protein